MRNFAAVVLIALCSQVMSAQDATKAEVFGGLSYANYSLLAAGSAVGGTSIVTSATYGSGRLSLLGWNGSVTASINRWFGLATDLSGYYNGASASTTTITTFNCGTGCTNTETAVFTDSRPKMHNFLFGPQFSYPSRKLRPFAHLLLGGERLNFTRTQSVTSTGTITVGPAFSSLSTSTNMFAMAFGGGADYSIKRNWSWRLESDYLTNQGTKQNHVRVSTGIVWQARN